MVGLEVVVVEILDILLHDVFGSSNVILSLSQELKFEVIEDIIVTLDHFEPVHEVHSL